MRRHARSLPYPQRSHHRRDRSFSLGNGVVSYAVSALVGMGVDPSGSWYLATLGLGFCTRIAALPALLYSDRAVARVAAAGPAVQRVFLQYAEVAFHPRALRSELELAHRKFLERRSAILYRYGTSDIATNVPLLVAAVVTVGCASVIGSSGFEALSGFHSATGNAAWGALPVDPLLACAMCFSALNADRTLARRTGFNERTDALVATTRRLLRLSTPCLIPLVYIGIAVLDPIPLIPVETQYQSVARFIRAVTPFAFGASVGGLLRTALGSSTAFRAMVRWPIAPPPQHGTYGDMSYSPAVHHERLAQIWEETEGAQHRRNYFSTKASFEAECDIRLQRMPIAKKFFRDTRYDTPPENPYSMDPDTASRMSSSPRASSSSQGAVSRD